MGNLTCDEGLKVLAALAGAVVLLAVVFAAGGMGFRGTLLFVAFMLPPAAIGMTAVIVAGQWLARRIHLPARIALLVTIPVGIVAACAGADAGFWVLWKVFP
jgi:hypothetical protein